MPTNSSRCRCSNRIPTRPNLRSASMPTSSVSDLAPTAGDRESLALAADGGLALAGKMRPTATGIGAGLAWLAFGWATLHWPDIGDWSRSEALGYAAFVIAALIIVATTARVELGRVGKGVQRRGPWVLALGGFLAPGGVRAAEFGWVAPPFFSPPPT